MKSANDKNQVSNETKPSLLKKIEGAAEVAAGVFLMTFPYATIAVAALGCAALTVKKYFDEPKTDQDGKRRSVWERVCAAAGMAFGTTVGMFTAIGALAIGVVGLKEAWMGNAASFDMVQGAVWGVASSVIVPVVGTVLIGEGAYKAVTGKHCNVLSFTYDIAKSTFLTIGNWCRVTQKPTQENVKDATSAAAKDLVQSASVHDIKVNMMLSPARFLSVA